MIERPNKRYKIIDTYTGSITEKDNLFPEMFNDDGYLIPHNKSGVTVYSDIRWPVGMTNTEIGGMVRLASCHLILGLNIIGRRNNGKTEVYSSSKLASVAGYKGRQGRRFMSRMIELNVIRKISTGTGTIYYVNPAIYVSGRRLGFNLFFVFRKELEGVLPAMVVKQFMEHIGFTKENDGEEKASLCEEAVSG